MLFIPIEKICDDVNLIVQCDEMFASSWVGELKSGWGQRTKNDGLKEVVRCFRPSADERVSVEALLSFS